MLKLDPKNTELLKQKQDILNSSIATTEEKLKQLKQIKEEADKKMAEGTQVNEENYRALQREIVNTQNKLNALKTENSGWNKAGNYLNNLGDELDSISSKIDSVGNKLTTRISLPITAVATAGIMYNAEIEKYTTAFATFLGDAKEAEKVITQIKDSASKTPFDVTSLVQANQMLISTGENAENAQETILALGDAVTATGGGNVELTRMAANLQQIKNAGQATALDIKQFAYAGIDIYGMLADYTGKTTAEVKDMTISYEDLTGALKKANQQGGKYYNAMNNASDTLTGQVNQLKAEVKDMTGELTKSLMPVAKKVVRSAKDLISKFDNLSDSQKQNIVNIGLAVAAAGPLLKVGSTAISTIGKVSSGLGTMTQAIGVATGKMTSSKDSVNSLANVFKATFSPTGLAVLGITAAVGIIVSELKKAEAETKAKFETMGDAAADFYNDLQTAEGYLSTFNDTIFASSQEQENLQEQMQEIQDGITQICKTASEERRDYTQEEITQLDEYFTKLRELKDREIEIYQSRIESIAQLAQTESDAFQGSLEEYKERGTQWIATAQDQAEQLIAVAENRRIEEIASLNEMYSEEERLTNENYLNAVAQAEQNYQQAVEAANKQVGEVSAIYTQGYIDRANQDGQFGEHVNNYLNEMKQLKEDHLKTIENINNQEAWSEERKNSEIQSANNIFDALQRKHWGDVYKYMSESEAEQLGSWLGMLANAELYGGKISDENKEMVNFLLDQYDTIPKETKKDMKESMEQMLGQMKSAQPGLFEKASGIAGGIVSRLKTSFNLDYSSLPGHKSGLDYVPYDNYIARLHKGERVLTAEENKQLMQMEKTSRARTPNMKAIGQSVADSIKTVFTTPTIVINAQDELTPNKINTIIDTVNRRLGSQY